MTDVESPEITPPAPDKVKIVFMRTSVVSASDTSDLFEVVDGELRYVGALVMGMKVAYETTPGEKVFMACGMAADFMLGDLSGGKIYYAVIRPNYGTGGMIPTPIRPSNMMSKEFASWVADTKLVAPNAEAKVWFNQEKDHFQDIYKGYWAKFQRKTPAEKAERTLNPQDGVLK